MCLKLRLQPNQLEILKHQKMWYCSAIQNHCFAIHIICYSMLPTYLKQVKPHFSIWRQKFINFLGVYVTQIVEPRVPFGTHSHSTNTVSYILVLVCKNDLYMKRQHSFTFAFNHSQGLDSFQLSVLFAGRLWPNRIVRYLPRPVSGMEWTYTSLIKQIKDNSCKLGFG